MPIKNSNNTARLLLKELPYFGINLIQVHHQLNNIIPSSLPTKKYLENLTSFYDLDQLSADGRATVGQLLADCWPTVGRLLANSWPTVGRQPDQQTANSLHYV